MDGVNDQANNDVTETTVSLNRVIESVNDQRFLKLEGRLKTFARWNTKTQKPEKLAKAGFIYTGSGDCVRCFCCNGGLRNWQQNDLPWVEHARWFPGCPYVRLKKGSQYVSRVHQLFVRQTQDIARLESSSVQNATSTQINAQNVELPWPDLPVLEQCTGIWHGIEDIMSWNRELDHPVYSLGTLRLCNRYGIAHAMVRVIIDVVKEAGLTLAWETIQKMITDHIEGGGVLPTDPSESIQRTDVEDVSTQHLFQENQRLLEALSCKVCSNNEANVVFLPCGHLVACTGCALEACRCPACISIIKEKVKVYRS